MRCDNCGEVDAVIQLTKVKDNETKVLHLCESCAADEGVETPAATGTLPLAEFLAQIGKGAGEEAVVGSCPTCGLTAAQLKQTGRLGCAECYTHFDRHLRALLRRLHGGTQHVGKTVQAPSPQRQDHAARLEGLRRSLRRAIDAEDFEQAAALRDQIRRAEGEEGGAT